MPKQIRTKVGEIHHVRTVKTFGDQVKEFAQGVAGIAIIIFIIVVIFG